MSRLGDTGPSVLALQQRLSALFFALATDGAFGDRTEEAVRAFQLVVGLPVDGVAGPTTDAALNGTAWEDVAATSTFQGIAHHRRTDEIVGTARVETFEVDVSWPVPSVDRTTGTAECSAYFSQQVHFVVDQLTPGPNEVPESETEPTTLRATIGTTLLAPTIIGLAGQFSHFVSGAAHSNPIIFTSNYDLDARQPLGAADLFMAGVNWPERLRSIALNSLPAPPDLDALPGLAATEENYRNIALTPDGLQVHLTREQLNLPFAAPMPSFVAHWDKLEAEIRPSIPARCHGQSEGGDQPILT